MMITAASLCVAITASSYLDNVKLPKSRIKLACKQSQNLVDAANKYKIDPLTLAALVWVESRWQVNAVSSANACGLTQVLPKYVKETCTELHNPKVSLYVGARILKKWSKNRDIDEALACYNAGYLCLRSGQARRYSKKVRKIEAILKKQIQVIESSGRRR